MRTACPLRNCKLCSLFYLLLAAAWLQVAQAQPGGSSQQVVVNNVAELRAALNAATAHIELQSHLDLRSEAPLAESAELPFPYMFKTFTGFESLRGNCTGPVPTALPQPTQALKPGQCVISVDYSLVRVHGGTPNALSSAWFDNLYLQTNFGPDRHVLHFLAYKDYQRIWWTNMVSEGARANSTAIVGEALGSQYYVGDSAFLNHKQAEPVVYVAGPSVTMRIQRSRFSSNVGVGLFYGAFGGARLSFAAVQNCTFDNASGLKDMHTYNSTIGVDDPEKYSTAHDDYPIIPLGQLPKNVTFLTDDHPDFVALKQAALQGRTSSTPPPPPPPPQPAPVDPVTPRSTPPEETSVAGPVAGGVAGAGVLLGALAVLAYWLTKRRNAATAYAARDERGADVKEVANGGAGPGMVVNMNDTLAAGTAVSGGAAGLYSQPSWMSGAASSAQAFHGAPSSMHGQGFAHDGSFPMQSVTTVSNSSGAPAMHPAAQPPPGWLQAPPVHNGVTTIYQLPSTAGSGGAAAAASMVATQRPAPALAEMMSAEAHKEQLERTLYTMITSQPPELFMGRFLLMQDRRGGGQAAVQFARGGDGGFFQYAIKFFNRVQDYAIEDAMYRNTAVKPVLPDLFAAAPNGDGAVRARSGYVFPPFLVMERGMTLAEWLQAPRDSLAVLSMFKDCAALLATLHAAGHVHRDLKPDNVLLMLQTQAWRLIDFGIAAPAGKEIPPRCTLGYAAPEVIKAFDDKSRIMSAAAQDVWALGVMVFEAFTRKPAVDPFGGVEGCVALARGEKQYPWEAAEQAQAFGGSRARQLVESCLERDPEQRPTAAALVNAITMISDKTKMVPDAE